MWLYMKKSHAVLSLAFDLGFAILWLIRFYSLILFFNLAHCKQYRLNAFHFLVTLVR